MVLFPYFLARHFLRRALSNLQILKCYGWYKLILHHFASKCEPQRVIFQISTVLRTDGCLYLFMERIVQALIDVSSYASPRLHDN